MFLNPATVPAVGMTDAFLFLYPATVPAVGMADAFLFLYLTCYTYVVTGVANKI